MNRDSRFLRRSIVSALLACALVVPVAAGLSRHLYLAGVPQSKKAAGSALTADKGKFRILLDGQQVGSEEFEINSSGREWLARGTSKIQTGEAAAQISSRLSLTADGAPLRYDLTVESPKKGSASVKFEGANAKLTAEVAGAQPYSQEFTFTSPRVIILDINLYHHYAVLAQLYDWTARGTQTFPVLIPQGPTPGTIDVEFAGPQAVEGATLDLLRARTPDLEVELYLDSSRRLVRLAVPAAKALLLRE